jgi:hypothetical protein
MVITPRRSIMIKQWGWYGVIAAALLGILSCSNEAFSAVPEEGALVDLIPYTGRQAYPLYGETLMKKELTVLAVYDTGFTQTVPVEDIEFTDLSFRSLGENVVALAYLGRTVEFTVTVIPEGSGGDDEVPEIPPTWGAVEITIGWAK